MAKGKGKGRRGGAKNADPTYIDRSRRLPSFKRKSASTSRLDDPVEDTGGWGSAVTSPSLIKNDLPPGSEPDNSDAEEGSDGEEAKETVVVPQKRTASAPQQSTAQVVVPPRPERKTARRSAVAESKEKEQEKGKGKRKAESDSDETGASSRGGMVGQLLMT